MVVGVMSAIVSHWCKYLGNPPDIAIRTRIRLPMHRDIEERMASLCVTVTEVYLDSHVRHAFTRPRRDVGY